MVNRRENFDKLNEEIVFDDIDLAEADGVDRKTLQPSANTFIFSFA